MAIPLAAPGPSRPLEPLLTPTWRRVDALPPREHHGQLDGHESGEDEWEEDEVEYVTLEFGQHLSAETLAETNAVQLLAAESATPIARIGHRYFEGVHETLIGTDILLLHGDDASPAYKPSTTSAHRITFQPVALVPPSGPQHAIGVAPANRGRNLGRGRGKGRGATVAHSPAPTELGPDGQPVKRKRGRPAGSKNKAKPAKFVFGPIPVPPEPAPAGGEIVETDAAESASAAGKGKQRARAPEEPIAEEEGGDAMED